MPRPVPKDAADPIRDDIETAGAVNKDQWSENEKLLPGGDPRGSNENDAHNSPASSSPSKDENGAANKVHGGDGGGTRTDLATVTFACCLYCFCSVSMVLANKSLASSYNHLLTQLPEPADSTLNSTLTSTSTTPPLSGGSAPPADTLNILLVVSQALVAVVAVSLSKRMGWVEPYPPFSLRTARQWAPVNVFFCGMLFTGMASLGANSVPMVTVFKNVTNVGIALGDFALFGERVDYLVLVSFGVMLAGAAAAARRDAAVTPGGAFWMTANCVCTAGYVLYMKHATHTVKLTKFGMVLYNNVLCAAFLLPVAFLNGEVGLLARSTALHTPAYAAMNVFAGFVGFFLNFASLNCVSVTGPTTYAMLGALNKIPIAILGYFLFDSVISGETWFFIAVSMCGGFLYSYAKIRSSG